MIKKTEREKKSCGFRFFVATKPFKATRDLKTLPTFGNPEAIFSDHTDTFVDWALSSTSQQAVTLRTEM